MGEVRNIFACAVPINQSIRQSERYTLEREGVNVSSSREYYIPVKYQVHESVVSRLILSHFTLCQQFNCSNTCERNFEERMEGLTTVEAILCQLLLEKTEFYVIE